MKVIQIALLIGWVAASGVAAEPAVRHADLPGQRPDGSVLLPNQWSLRPVGKQVALGDFPVNIAVHPRGRYAAVLHCGYGAHEVVIVDIPRARIVSRVDLDQAFYGIRFSSDGDELFASGAGDEVIHVFEFRRGYLSDHRELRLRPVAQRGVCGGLDVSTDAGTLWVANPWGQSVSFVSADGGTPPVDVVLRQTPLPESTNPPAITPPKDPDLAAATKRAEALLDPTTELDPFPYTCVADEGRHRLYVSLWAQAQVVVLDLKSRGIEGWWTTGEHPNEMVLSPGGEILYVANANRNTVTVLETSTGRTLETLSSALYPSVPPGSTPNSLALSPDGRRLFVANACNNNVAVFDVEKPGSSRALGFIPVGWYPTSVRVTPDGGRLLVANGKGLTSLANRHGPQPGPTNPPHTVTEYIAGLLRGTLEIIDLPRDEDAFHEKLRTWTKQAYACSPMLADPGTAEAGPAGSPIPSRVGDPSPIKYCLYILKENRTYDQVLGDLPQGNGDPALCLFPEEVTPNHHALAREFVLLDNFYVESEVSADGHEWSLGAYATDYVEKTWPLNYGHNGRGKVPYPSEGRFTIAMPSTGYLWDRARAAGITYRSYGSFTENGKTAADPTTSRLPALVDHLDSGYRGWDLEYADVKRTDRFIAELKRFEQAGEMPRLQILRLPNDHTYGTSPGKRSPRAMVADNDLALGRLIEALSRSKFWSQTAVFVVEDDAQNGPDHVDAHRTIAFAVSPYSRRAAVDSTMYSTCSMLRTMELILGLEPMTQFDAAALPMYNAFQSEPDLHPYTAKPVTVDREERNLATAWGAGESEHMDFSKEDAADDIQLNEVIWRSVRGALHPMPAPVRAGFVFVLDDGDEDSDADRDRDRDDPARKVRSRARR